MYTIEYIGLFGSLTKLEITEVMDIDLIITLKKNSTFFKSYNEMLYEHNRIFKFLRTKQSFQRKYD